MKRFWNALTALLSRYGQYGAGLASVHGSYEVPVPEMLQQQNK